MHTRTFSLLMAGLVVFVSSLALAPAASAQREPMRPVCQVQKVSDNTTIDVEPQIDAGQVVWMGNDGADSEIYFWDGTEVTNLSNNNTDDLVPQIDGGQVVWYGWDGADYEIYLWDGVTTTQLTDNTGDDMDPQIDGGQVVWSGFDGADYEIYLWDGVTTTQLTNNANNDQIPQIDGGQVVWSGFDGTDNEIYLWDGVTITALSNNNENDNSPQIDGGQVVWFGWDGNDQEIYLWESGVTTQLTDNTIDDGDVQIDNGQLVWFSYDGNDYEVYFWDGMTTTRLTDNFQSEFDPEISGGQVVWRGFDGTDSEIYLWDGAAITNISDNTMDDWTPLINDGQVVWFGNDGVDDEIFFADCDYVSYPLDLAVTGDLTSAPVLPLLSWTHQATMDQITAVPQFRVVLMTGGTIALDRTIDAANFCVGTECTLPLSRVVPRSGLLNGNYEWWVGAITLDGTTTWSGGSTFDPATFTVTVPNTALPSPITVNPADGRIGITFPDDPGTLWVQVWIGPHPDGNYFEWHERNGADKAFKCDGTECVIHPEWDVTSATNLTVWMQAWGPAGFSSGGTVADAWNDSNPFDLPIDPATLPSNITIGGTWAEPAFGWTGGANATWYNLVIRPAGSTTVAHSSWHQASAANCPGALVNPADYECVVAWLGLADELTASASYDVFVSAWGPGGFSSGSGISGMDEYAQGGPFTYKN